ncbi:uncharacterized protein LOC126901796 [Daktulosphaira vitifoliae]|uniref:uncharacterized protein LOC126901796 n=1 Tax=Daktulosphaira vitifoliae TaxID=58002 RepID=UPI0021AAB83C|nr:uncharacterized protein LOC126901796 [Daktulosphaira vitifoliae]
MILLQFIDLNIFIGYENGFLVSIKNSFHMCLSLIRSMRLKVVDLPHKMLNKLELFMNNNLLKFNIELETNFTKENVMHIHDIIFEKGNQVELYLQELHKYGNSLHSIFVTQCLENIKVKVNKKFLPQNLIDHLCSDNPIDYSNSTKDKCVINDDNSELSVHDLGNNDGLDEFKTTNIEKFRNPVCKGKKNESLNELIDMKDLPKHMVDYFICP